MSFLVSPGHTKMIQLKVPPLSPSLLSSASKKLTARTNHQTLLNCIDNSGALVVECAQIARMKRPARIGTLLVCRLGHWPDRGTTADSVRSPLAGDEIVVVVQKHRSHGEGLIGANKVKRGDIRHAVVVRCAKELQRRDGHVVRFDDNACVLIGKNKDPLGTRVVGTYIRPPLAP